MAVDKFTTSDGVKLAYYIDDYTDPWRQADTLLLLHAARPRTITIKIGYTRRVMALLPWIRL